MFIFHFSKSVYHHCLKLTRVYSHEVIFEPFCNFCFILKSFNSVMSFSKAVIVLSSVKLYNEDFFKKPIKSFLNMLNSKVPRIDPLETPESSV